MAYFNELPDLEVVSRFPNQSTNQDYVTIKNLWKRAKLREDIAEAITAFTYYQIKDGERPDQIAERVYGDPELDWVILVTNNITNINDQWPLDNNSLYKYLIDKYGSEEELNKVHHSETLEQRDDKHNRLIIPEGLKVDELKGTPSNFTTIVGTDEYPLDIFFSGNDTVVSVNLIQALQITQNAEGEVLYRISDINIDTSNLKVYTRNGDELDINIDNALRENWPSSWGGGLIVYGRDINYSIPIVDVLSDTIRIIINEKLYEINGKIINGVITPVFRFRYL